MSRPPENSFAALIAHRWWLVVVSAAAAAGIAVLVLSQLPRSYQATSTLQAPTASASATLTSGFDPTYADRLMNTYKTLALGRDFRLAVAKSLGRSQPVDLSATIAPNSELMTLSVRNRSGAVAQQEANAAGVQLAAQVNALASSNNHVSLANLDSQLNLITTLIAGDRSRLAALPNTAASASAKTVLNQAIGNDQLDYQALVQQKAQLQLAAAIRSNALSVVDSAQRPPSPVSEHLPLVLIAALLLGALGGAAVAAWSERRAPRLYTIREIETATDSSMAIAIPRVDGENGSEHTTVFNSGSSAQEAFGMLRARLLAGAYEHARTLVVASAREGEGKSTIAANLAAALARSDRPVLLVDADMRRPTVHRVFELSNEVGLSDILQGEADLDEVLNRLEQPDVPNLTVLPAGPEPTRPAELLASPRMRDLVQRLAEMYYVILDTPALIPVSDATAVVRHVDQVLLVVGGAPVRESEVQHAWGMLKGAGAEHISVVVNRYQALAATGSYYYRAES